MSENIKAEQDADRAAFEPRYTAQKDRIIDSSREGWDEFVEWENEFWLNHGNYPRQFQVWQAAKADIRAMQDAFERVCEALEVARYEIETAKQFEGIFYGSHYGSSVCEQPIELIDSALTIAAPYRKGAA